MNADQVIHAYRQLAPSERAEFDQCYRIIQRFRRAAQTLEASEGKSIRCPSCGRSRARRAHVENRFCPYCHHVDGPAGEIPIHGQEEPA